MAELVKYTSNEVRQHLVHDLRELPAHKSYGNESVDRELSSKNECLISRGNATETNKYRKNLLKDIFHYNRKNVVHAVEICVQVPDDCPPEQHERFFRETLNYISAGLPMGEKCILSAVIHRDERKYSPNGVLLSKDHLHVMYVPAVADKKHDGFQWKLCADDLTKRKDLKAFHPGLQKHLKDAGISATVHKKGNGKTIALSVPQMKEITDKTGYVFDGPITVERLSEILQENMLQRERIKELEQLLDREQQQTEKKTSWERSSGWGKKEKEVERAW